MNDYAGLLAPPDRARLEARLAERARATGTQMAIAIFPSLEGESLGDVSIKLAESWRIGQKGLDNGIILVVFVQERKLRLEVGYGLEASITDAVSSQIIREGIAPRFREGRHADGLAAAIDAVYARIERGPAAGKRSSTPPPWPIVGFGVLIAVIAAILGLEAMRSRRFVERRGFTAGRGRDSSGPVIVPWGGGGRGGGGGGGGFSGGGGGFGGGGASGDW